MCQHARTFRCVYNMYTYVHACIHAHIHTCTHTYMHTHTHTPPYPTLPYPTLPYPTLPYPTLPYPTLPYPTLPYPTLPYPTLPYPTLCTYVPLSSRLLETSSSHHQGPYRRLAPLGSRLKLPSPELCVWYQRLPCREGPRLGDDELQE